MPNINGRLVNNTVAFDSGGNEINAHALLDDKDVIGGYKVVKNSGELNALAEAERIAYANRENDDERFFLKKGCLVYVSQENKTYRWDGNAFNPVADEEGLAEIAKSGSFNDLIDVPQATVDSEGVLTSSVVIATDNVNENALKNAIATAKAEIGVEIEALNENIENKAKTIESSIGSVAASLQSQIDSKCSAVGASASSNLSAGLGSLRTEIQDEYATKEELKSAVFGEIKLYKHLLRLVYFLDRNTDATNNAYSNPYFDFEVVLPCADPFEAGTSPEGEGANWVGWFLGQVLRNDTFGRKFHGNGWLTHYVGDQRELIPLCAAENIGSGRYVFYSRLMDIDVLDDPTTHKNAVFDGNNHEGFLLDDLKNYYRIMVIHTIPVKGTDLMINSNVEAAY